MHRRGVMASTHQFKAQVGGLKGKLRENLSAFVRECAFEVCFRAVDGTPVDFGVLKGSWQPAIGQPANIPGQPDTNGAYVMSRISMRLLDIDIASGQKFYLTNNCVYARRIEYGFVGPDSLGRVFNQPGRFYVTRAVKSWNSIVKSTAQKFAARGWLS